MGMNLSTYINMLKDGVNTVSIENENISRYAMVLDGTCIGVTLWNGDTNTWTPPQNITLVKLDENLPVSSGWLYINSVWTQPPVQVLEEIS